MVGYLILGVLQEFLLFTENGFGPFLDVFLNIFIVLTFQVRAICCR